MSKILIIVESKTKATKIATYIDKNYTVIASNGHIVDLDPKKLSIDVNNNFEQTYSIKEKQHDTVKKIKEEYKKCDDVLIASDKDREGEMIGYNISTQLKIKEPKRIYFTSITKNEILNAIKNPTTLDYNMIDAQKTRRIVDRLVGFKLTELLWKYIDKTCSSGRVQSIALKIIVDRENEINNFFENFENKVVSFFKFTGIFIYKDIILKANMISNKKNNIKNNNNDNDENDDIENSTIIEKYDDALKMINNMAKSIFTVIEIKNREIKKQPLKPFETSSLQQEAHSKFGYTPKITMSLAQTLYEGGFITYIRTDAITLSDECMNELEKYILKNYGKKYYKRTEYKTNDETSQGAHECIRPTDINKMYLSTDNIITERHNKLYELIWKRTIASQMENAIYNVNTITIDISKIKNYYFVSIYEQLIFNGFLKVYGINHDNNINNIDIKKGNIVNAKKIDATEYYKDAPKRYNDGQIVARLKKLNIGRPATYATYCDKIESKNLVKIVDIDGIKKDIKIITFENDEITIKKDTITIGKETKKYIPTHMGIMINTFLEKYFSEIINYNFTSNLENDLDLIAIGKLKWLDVMNKFYVLFSNLLNSITELKINLIINNNEKILGKDNDGNEIIATVTKYGNCIKKLVNNKWIYSPVQSIETITLDDAIKLFEYPISIGKYNRKNVVLKKGKFGYWLQFGNSKDNSISFGFNETLELSNNTIHIKNITVEHLNEIIEKYKNNNTNNNALKTLSDEKYKYIIMNGKNNMFVICKSKDMKKNKNKKDKTFSIPNDININDITLDKIVELFNSNNKYSKFKNTKVKDDIKDDIKVNTKVNIKDHKKDNKKVNIKDNKKVIIKETKKVK
jgi:DNA topoisomerase-1